MLEAIKSTEKYKSTMENCSDKNIVIQLGEQDRETTIATHFPCTCLNNGDSLSISCESEDVQVTPDQCGNLILSRNEYSFFYIDSDGGQYSKTKKLFRSNIVKQFKYLCVYAEKGLTVEDALRRDGRFIDTLGTFHLSDNDDPKRITERTQKVDNLDQNKFKICLPRKRKRKGKQQENDNNTTQRTGDTGGRHQGVVSIQTVIQNSDSSVNIQEIYEILHSQFPNLREVMESRFPGDSYEEMLKLRQENFGHIQQSFNEVHRVRKLLKLGESVCQVIVAEVIYGTGFVLFDNFILTNAHLFKDCLDGGRLMEDVLVRFNYEDPTQDIQTYFQLAHSKIYCSEDKLDYAVFEIKPESQNYATETKNVKVPPGLLKHFGPVPINGEGCIVGHPEGKVKKLDPICIILKENREQNVQDELKKYTHLNVHSIKNSLFNLNIQNIMVGGNQADQVITYKTFMYNGSSGSPVFDACGRVFGLHSAGFVVLDKKSVIEFAHPLLLVFEHFVQLLRDSREEELLNRLLKEAKDNKFLKRILVVSADTDERSDSNEAMEVDPVEG